ncbi:GNAT family N-acetyltransferase [Chromobacterium subtsugae]|uniref:GNAT family N-acetyltransferase n=1 Tax=Chromobacterium subtsugae TaxID=251747 RepID=A0ABS7FGE8_9NEIS|nr:MULTISPECIES: GNAT family N-acetyltransferase [Chromobacterium]MBW7567890.1 GNAT family N-acetyltransferase [Chromobacterium subtsugae]MBW8289117.1 GNAT family N-acetyltransferase [Chromobacterium subtsugae]WSE93739.1 GNAT family N-acetyltransferase [Chromobacterium subtsugae]WVH62116.1 GNAT family N-acetyltransferase [Chromobacterium subtsugae]
MKTAPLTRLSPADLHPCFLEAFSDYLVPAQPSLESFSAMLRRRGWVPELSAGAWIDGRLAGFWLCATPPIDDGMEGYCIAAGVVPAARRQGALSAMAARVARLLARRGIHQQRLEVIDGNQRAQLAYAQLGFQPLRQLDCYLLQAPIDSRRHWPVTVHHGYTPARWPSADWLAYPPAVPNRRDSLRRAIPAPRWLTVDAGGAALGSLLLSADGEALELMVDPAHRRRGIASQLLRAGQLLTPGGRLAFNNVDRRDLALLSLLLRHQAAYRLSQWEMLKPAAAGAGIRSAR